MANNEIAPRKQCPDCGWDAEGKAKPGTRVGLPAATAIGQAAKTHEAVAYEYVCGNCGFEWTVQPS